MSVLKVLVRMAAGNKRYSKEIESFLLKYVREGRPLDLPTRIEEYEGIMDGDLVSKILDALHADGGAFKKAQVSRINRVLKRQGRIFERG